VLDYKYDNTKWIGITQGVIYLVYLAILQNWERIGNTITPFYPQFLLTLYTLYFIALEVVQMN